MDEKNKEYVSKFCVGCGKRVFRAKDRDIVRKAGKGRRGVYQDWVHQKPRGEKLPGWAQGESRTTEGQKERRAWAGLDALRVLVMKGQVSGSESS